MLIHIVLLVLTVLAAIGSFAVVMVIAEMVSPWSRDIRDAIARYRYSCSVRHIEASVASAEFRVQDELRVAKLRMAAAIERNPGAEAKGPHPRIGVQRQSLA